MKSLSIINRIVLFVSLIVFCSCDALQNLFPEEEQKDHYNYSFTAGFSDQQTRLSSIGIKVLWNEDDEIAVFAGEHGPYKFVTSVNGPSAKAEFKGNIPDEYLGLPLICGYPYDSFMKCDGKNITVDLINSVLPMNGDGSELTELPLVAKPNGKTVSFHSVCGFIEIKVPASGVSEIRLRGNDEEVVRGVINVSFGDGGEPVSMGPEGDFFSSHGVAMRSISDDMLIPGSYFYVPIIPTTLNNGYNVRVDAINKHSLKVTLDPVVIRSGEIAGSINLESSFTEMSIFSNDEIVPSGGIPRQNYTGLSFHVSSSKKTSKVVDCSICDGYQPVYYDIDGTVVNYYTSAPVIVLEDGFNFFGFSSVKSLDLSCFDTSLMKDMGNMFMMCTSLTSLNLSGFNTSRVTNMSCMFDWCSSLTSLDLSGFKTSNVEDMANMFLYCGNIQSLDLGKNFDMKSVKYQDCMCDGLGTDVAECSIRCTEETKTSLQHPDVRLDSNIIWKVI